MPITGRKTLNIIPDDQALALGEQSYQQVLSTNKLIKSGPQYDQVLRVGQRVAAATGATDMKWEFNLIDDPKTLNAFCLPGGKVAVYSGILPLTKTDAGLATVLSHEIGHAIAKHGSERMTDELALQVAQTGLAALLGDKSPATQNLILTAFGAGSTVGVMLPFSRKQESEADHMGLIYMAQAGYDPHEAITFWNRMVQAMNGSEPPKLLSDHPANADRVKALQDLLPEAMKDYHPQKG